MDPVNRGGEEDIGAEATSFFEDRVVTDNRVEVGIVGDIGTAAVVGLTDPAGTVNKHLIETTLMRLIRLFIPEVPFAKNAGSVPHGLQSLCQRDGVQGHPFTFKDRVSDAIPHGMATGHQC
jgi:hypothetical protein